MKKVLEILLVLCLLLTVVSCTRTATTTPAAEVPAARAPAAEEPAQEPTKVTAEVVRGVTAPPFSIKINGTTVTNEVMVAYPMYSVQAFSINSSGTKSTCNYVGFAISDVLAAVGITNGFTNVEAAANDGYAIKVEAALAKEPTTLLAVTKDGEQFKEGPWFAPCSSQTTGDYLKGMAVLTVDAKVTITPNVGKATAEKSSSANALPEISDKTDKVQFKAYEFKVNGKKVTNETLKGLSIYKITVTTINSKGNASESTYTGYQLADVLTACGVKDYTRVDAVANDGYTTTLKKATVSSDYTLLAIEKDKNTGDDGTIWIAPCEQTESKAYAKLVVEIKSF